ncbi:MAG TPA: TetR/AcrR family transcriptional regulator [Solirubrobacteraceae bacterium]|nr:TetR/AcrR family transcriptional regulator [Solirubrobacteraceae bacterium]
MAPSQRREQVIDAALQVIVEQGYAGVSIEAIARTAGVTRPVIYDHFPNLGALLQALIEREERIALRQLAEVIPGPELGAAEDPVALLGSGVRRFLEAVRSRPPTWRIILLPLDGTPAIVREHVETNRAHILERLRKLVEWGTAGSSTAVDVELAAGSILALAEEAGRRVLTDPDRFGPDRYEAFVLSIAGRLAGRAPGPPAHPA